MSKESETPKGPMADIDFGKLSLQQGEISDSLKEKCLELCKDYLAGNWKQQTLNTIEVRTVSGGFTNQLYFCGISKPLANSEDVPQEVLIRLYGPKHFNVTDCEGNERLTDIVSSLMVSEHKLGPEVYGLFEEGQIQAYYKHRQLNLEDQKDPILVQELFEKLARIHALDVPIKRSHWFCEELDNFYELSFKKFPINELIKDLNCETFLRHDLKTEINWIKDLISKTNSPLVFTHNDFRNSNILVLENKIKGNTGADEQILLCDYEYSSYGYRGTDFGSIINEWGRNWHDFTSSPVFPEDSILKTFINTYIEESKRLIGPEFSEDKLNSLEQILIEVKVFSLARILFIVLLSLKTEPTNGPPFPMDKAFLMKQLAETNYKNYWLLKNKFVAQNIFKQ